MSASLPRHASGLADLRPPVPPLFTRGFFVMCAFSFTVFLSAFQLLPTAPFRILDLGGSTLAAGAFLGCLTCASALSAPFTGALADRIGRRRMLLVCSLVLSLFCALYGVVTSYRLMLLLAVVHGCFWSGLLSASAAHTTELIPLQRRAEGIGVWGLSTIVAVAVAPAVGFWLYDRGWQFLCAVTCALNLGLAGIAYAITEAREPSRERFWNRDLLEWRVLFVSGTLFLYSYGYGSITSFVALYAHENGAPKSLYFSVLALTILCTRPTLSRLADRIGHRKVLLPALVAIAIGLGLLAVEGTSPWLVASAVVFGAGFGSAYPVFAARIMSSVDGSRRGAAFGGILAAFDTGIGTGSLLSGWLIGRAGYGAAFGVATALALLALPYFLFAERRLEHHDANLALAEESCP